MIRAQHVIAYDDSKGERWYVGLRKDDQGVRILRYEWVPSLSGALMMGYVDQAEQILREPAFTECIQLVNKFSLPFMLSDVNIDNIMIIKISQKTVQKCNFNKIKEDMANEIASYRSRQNR